MATNSFPFGLHFPASLVLKDVLLLSVLCFCSLSGQLCQVIPALPSLLASLGYFALFATHCHGYSSSSHPPAINYFCQPLHCACHSWNSLQVFGVFVFMEWKKCTQRSRCALAHHACSKKDQDLVCHDVVPQHWQRRGALAFPVASGRWPRL